MDRLEKNTITPKNEVSYEVVHSNQYSDNLYHFTRHPQRILDALKQGYFTLNYFDEDMSYLRIDSISVLWFAAICFCDIPLRKDRIKPHMKQYGFYGIGLQKSWGIGSNVLPVHYLVCNTSYVDDFRTAFNVARKDQRDDDENYTALVDHLVTQLAYFKPFQENGKCYEDECEWRFLPREETDLPIILTDETVQKIEWYRGALKHQKDYYLYFEYEMITEIIVPDEAEKKAFFNEIDQLPIGQGQKEVLKTKVMHSEELPC